MKKFSLILIFACSMNPELAWPQGNKLFAPGPQPNELGKPFLKNWSAKEYGAGGQNWAIAQDDRGVMYFGNNDGVLEYDGVAWRLLGFAENSFVRSLAIASDGKLYVGGKGEFGYFLPVHESVKDGKAKSPFKRQYVSLLKYLQPEDRKFTDVWEIAISTQGVFFQTEKRLFRYVPPPPSKAKAVYGEEDSLKSRMHIWKSKTKFHGLASAYDRIYIAERETGLMEVKADSLYALPGGEKIGGAFQFIAPFSDGDGREKIYIGTGRGLFWYDGINCQALEGETASFLKELRINDGLVLPDNTVALATFGDGVVIIDPAGKGRVLQVINKTSGLKDETGLSIFFDRQGGLWLALNNGIARVETPAPLTFYDETRGLQGSCKDIIRYQNTLYAGTDIGLYYLLPSPEIFPLTLLKDGRGTVSIPQPVFKPVAGINTYTWALLVVPQAGELLAGTEYGLYRIRGDKAEFLMTFGTDIVSLHLSSRDSNRVYAGLRYGGLAAARYVPGIKGSSGSWINEGKIAGIEDEYITNIAEEADGSLWLAAKYKNYLIRLVFPQASSSPANTDLLKPKIQHFGAAQGLPEQGTSIKAALVAEQIYAYSGGSILRFDALAGSLFLIQAFI
jgi:hypothetical protein